MQENEEKVFSMSQPRWMSIYGSDFINGFINTPVVLIYLKLGLVWMTIHHFVEYTPVETFQKFVQFVVNARCQRDKNPNCSVVAETTKLLANSSYSYKNMDCSRHSIEKFTKDEKTHATNMSNAFNW